MCNFGLVCYVYAEIKANKVYAHCINQLYIEPADKGAMSDTSSLMAMYV